MFLEEARRHSVVDRSRSAKRVDTATESSVRFMATRRKYVTWVQRHVRRTWNVDPPGHKAILKWERTLQETRSLLPQTGKHAKVSVNEETIERVRTAFARSPRKSTRRASTELEIPRSTIHKIIHKCLHLSAFKIHLRHNIKPNDRSLRAHFAAEMLL